MKTKDNKIDGLFRDRLDGYEMEPSDGAREMMDRIITGRYNRKLYVRLAVAAGIMLVITSGIILTGYLNNSHQDIQAGTIALSENDLYANPGNDNPVKVAKPAVQNPVTEKVIKQDKDPETVALKTLKNSPDEKRNENQETGTIEVVRPEPVKMLESKFLAVASNENIKETIPVKSGNIETTTMKQSPVVIEYIADNGPVKGGKPQLMEGIVSKAKEIGRDVNLGEIRDLKDQLFALDFIKTRKSK